MSGRALLTSFAALVALAAYLAVTAPPTSAACARSSPVPDAVPVRGRLIVLPGVSNTRFHLAGFVERAERLLPGFEIEVRPWGVPLMRIHNLRAYERNREFAAALAAEIAEWRRADTELTIYVLGYSGGGGIAALTVAALPDDIRIDRLVLVAPAISPGFPVDSLLRHVDEFAVNYASKRDLQVGWGTRTFGTIDRVGTESAGAVGFAKSDPRLLEWRWSESDEAVGHGGSHLAYLGRRWQAQDLMPVLDPALGAAEIQARWDTACIGEPQ
jgi:pimeloyl-ACP methyl ester carboxylesterase